ncbi:GNAT family N-acetyltransferase [Anabaena sp. FACHB-1237]|uniref:GNAT family N-acetyltransferase n=1 Tax=Anabaena sp. FACHB-1237 TaxID=2692769 RepID=UPI0016808580|nr:GNAT family N-acetyltransferase [Anabaena sp. FACHB-1237]MBD2139610.1 GNAT family N-acetyltransferase [Anabaena sp. FACHB-1237]
MNYQIVNQLNETQISQLVELYKHESWSKNRTYAGVVKMLAGSDMIIAFINEEQELIAFCRLLSDGVYRAVIYDVIIHSHYRKMGLGTTLLDAVLNHPELKEVEVIALYCLPEMVQFYQSWGFHNDLKLQLMYIYN